MESFNLIFISPWQNSQVVSQNFNIIRDELSYCSKIANESIINKFLNQDEIIRYSDIIRYKNQIPISLGIISIMTYLKSNGIETSYIHMENEKQKYKSAKGWLNDSVKDIVERYKPAMICIGSTTNETNRAIQLCRLIKAQFPKIIIVVGGNHATHRPEDFLHDGLADIIVIGEGEKPMLSIYDRAKKKQGFDNIDGTASIKNGVITKHSPSVGIDLETISPPDFSLIDDNLVKKGILYTMFSRGCVNQCVYCSEKSSNNKGVKFYNVKKFIETLTYITDIIKWRFVHLADSNFLANEKKVIQFCDELEESGINALFSINVRPDLSKIIKKETIIRLRKLGFIEFLIGSESGCDRVLQHNKRNHTVKDLYNTLNLLKECQIPYVSTYWIVGLPSASIESELRTLSVMKELFDTDLIYYGSSKPYIPLPGTLPFNNPMQWDIEIKSYDWDLYDRYSLPLPYVHNNLSHYEIESLVLLMQSIQVAAFQRRSKSKKYDIVSLKDKLIGSYEQGHYL
ncbi:MAG: B12-binding domain-containing radical SAM protein [Defluviitaleaceae bacterium]|nr:B12-binding domain-containing radical SAM protein [Defluviitaleaceae bacterium]